MDIAFLERDIELTLKAVQNSGTASLEEIYIKANMTAASWYGEAKIRQGIAERKAAREAKEQEVKGG